MTFTVNDMNSNWEMLYTLLGSVRDGSDQSVKIYQDDATMNWFVNINDRKVYYGSSLAEALRKAVQKTPEQIVDGLQAEIITYSDQFDLFYVAVANCSTRSAAQNIADEVNQLFAQIKEGKQE
jgi:hypothetical protein